MNEPAPPSPAAGAVTRLLRRLEEGDGQAEGELFRLLEHELRALASAKLLGQRVEHTLQVTALVNEAWIRLAAHAPGLSGSQHFLAVAARAMRSVLVDHARQRRSAKRGGSRERVPLDAVVAAYEDRTGDLLELESALEELALQRPRQAKIVELRFFGGLSVEQTADVLSVSRNTVLRDWQLARIRLRDTLGA